MNNQQYRSEINALKNKLGDACAGYGVGLIIPAAMELVLSAVLSIDDKPEALKCAQAPRPMIDYIESQISGSH